MICPCVCVGHGEVLFVLVTMYDAPLRHTEQLTVDVSGANPVNEIDLRASHA